MGNWLSQALIVGLGGFLGAVVRFGRDGGTVRATLNVLAQVVGGLALAWLGFRLGGGFGGGGWR